MLLKLLINTGVRTVSGVYPEGEAREMVFAFLEHHLGTKRHTHIVEPDREVSQEDASAAIAAFERMASGEPLQYVTGVADFYGRQFRVTSGVLIPRPETELLCREMLKYAKNTLHAGQTSPMILDLCTGSGCIAWTLALERPGAKVTAVDISDAALAVASSQDFSEEISGTGAIPPVFVKADVLAGASETGISDRFDILVSNPPYVMDKEKALMRSNVLDHEPHLALFVSDDDPLVFYRSIAQWSLNVLKTGGYGMVEINEALGPQTADVFRDSGLRDVEILKDLSERDRFVLFRR